MQDSTEDNINNTPQPIQPTPTPPPVPGTAAQQPNAYADPISQQPSDSTFAESPIPGNNSSLSPSPVSSTPVSDSSPFTPDKPEQKSKKKLIIGVVAAVIAVITIGGSSAFAAYYMNPEKVVTDAFVDAATTRTQISSGSLLYTNTKNKDKISLTFASKSDTPNYKGQLDAKLKVDYEKREFEIAGTGMLSESGNAYFKFDGVEKAIKKYIDDPEVKTYTDRSPKLKEDLLAFAKKIDGKYIKLSKADMQNIWKEYDHSKAKECYTKAFDDLDKSSLQRKQIYDVYNQNKFVIIKDQGSESIDGVDSIKYGIGADMVKYSRASEALQNTIFSENLQRCQDKLTGQKTEDTEDQQTAEEKKEMQKYRDESAKEQQKEVDKAKVNIWISRWGHQFTKTTFSYNNKDSNTNYAVDINYKLGQKVSVADPANSIPMKEFQADIDKIQADFEAVNNQEIPEDQADTATAGDSVTNRANTTRAQTNAQAIQKRAEAYAAEVGAGSYPISTTNFSGDIAALPQGLSLLTGSSQLSASNGLTTINYLSCASGQGYQVKFWDYNKGSVSTSVLTGGTQTNCATPAS